MSACTSGLTSPRCISRLRTLRASCCKCLSVAQPGLPCCEKRFCCCVIPENLAPTNRPAHANLPAVPDEWIDAYFFIAVTSGSATGDQTAIAGSPSSSSDPPPMTHRGKRYCSTLLLSCPKLSTISDGSVWLLARSGLMRPHDATTRLEPPVGHPASERRPCPRRC